MLRKYERASWLPVLSATALAREFATALAMRVFRSPGVRRARHPSVPPAPYCSKRSLWTYGKLNGVADGLDLPLQSADLLVRDVGDLFEHRLLDFRDGSGVRG